MATTRWSRFQDPILLFGGFNTSPPQGGHLLPDSWLFRAQVGWTRLAGSCPGGQPDDAGKWVGPWGGS